MKTMPLAILLFALTTAAFAAEPRSYAGKWSFDPALSKGLPTMYADVTKWTLDVTQNAEHVKVDVHIENKRPDRPSLDQAFDYALNGSETSSTSRVMTPNGPLDVPTKLTARVKESGALDITITRELTMGEQTRHLVIKEAWELSADGKTLTVHRKDERPQGESVEFDVVFKKSE
jgi:hypothetical protein